MKPIKIRINNPDHSRAVQEWLFRKGYKWAGSGPHAIRKTYAKFMFTGTHVEGVISTIGNVNQTHQDHSGDLLYFERDPREEVDLSYLDPHLSCQEDRMKPIKIRINNPDHSHAVQEWLFGQGYKWPGVHPHEVRQRNARFIYTSTFTEEDLSARGNTNDTDHNCAVQLRFFENDPREEVDLSHLDPHLCSSVDHSRAKFANLSRRLRSLDDNIEWHMNQRSMMIAERDQILNELASELPEGYYIRRTSDED